MQLAPDARPRDAGQEAARRRLCGMAPALATRCLLCTHHACEGGSFGTWSLLETELAEGTLIRGDAVGARCRSSEAVACVTCLVQFWFPELHSLIQCLPLGSSWRAAVVDDLSWIRWWVAKELQDLPPPDVIIALSGQPPRLHLSRPLLEMWTLMASECDWFGLCPRSCGSPAPSA